MKNAPLSLPQNQHLCSACRNISHALYTFENEWFPTTVAQERQHVVVVGCRTFLFNIPKIPGGTSCIYRPVEVLSSMEAITCLRPAMEILYATKLPWPGTQKKRHSVQQRRVYSIVIYSNFRDVNPQEPAITTYRRLAEKLIGASQIWNGDYNHYITTLD